MRENSPQPRHSRDCSRSGSSNPGQVERDPHDPGGQQEGNDGKALHPLHQTSEPLGFDLFAAQLPRRSKNHRQAIFHNDADRAHYLERLEHYRRRVGRSARAMLVYVAREWGGMSTTELGRRL